MAQWSASRQAAAIVSKASDSNDRAGAYLVLAACCQKRGETQAALANARAATLAAPGDAVAHYAYAELQEATGDTAGAKASLERALAIQPAFVQAHHYLGILRGETVGSGQRSFVQPDFEVVLSDAVSLADAMIIGCSAELEHFGTEG